MSRLRSFLAISCLAIGNWGCAQCDTCDDFPAPCLGPNCGMGGMHNGPVNGGAAMPNAGLTPAAAANSGASNGGDAVDAPPPPSTSGDAKPDAAPAMKPLELNRPSE